MNTAFVVSGRLTGHTAIRLEEPIPLEDGIVRIVIESAQTRDSQGRTPDLAKLVVRTVEPFEPLSRDESHER